LSKLGQNRVIRSSYFWFIFVPIAARFVQQINEPLQRFLFGPQHQTIWFDVPFSWFYFFFAAVLFAIATFLYSVSCPEIIQRYSSPIDYYRAGYGTLRLLDYFNRLPRTVQSGLFSNLTNEVDKALGRTNFDRVVTEEPSDELLLDLRERMWRIRREELGEIFELLYNRFDVSQPVLRTTITLIYYAGFVLMARVMFESFRFVWSTWLNSQ
jgi:hypothetical protein